jgi:hypothetical protein
MDTFVSMSSDDGCKDVRNSMRYLYDRSVAPSTIAMVCEHLRTKCAHLQSRCPFSDTITDIDQHYAVVRIEALLLGAFIGQLLTTLNDANDDDAAANGSFEELCRSMARSYVIRSNNTAQWNNLNGSNSSTRWIPLGAKHPTIPIGCKEWSVLADSLIKEFAGARMTIDDVHEHELQLLIWKRFVHKLVAVMAAAMNKSTNTRLTIEN